MTVPADAQWNTSINRSTARELTDPMREFLQRQPFATLATHNPDGSIHLVPVWFLFSDGRFYVATWSGTRKVRNVAVRPGATITVDDRETAEWVSAAGVAELLEGAEAARANDSINRKYLTECGIDVIGGLMERAEDATIVITPHRWKAWDYQSTMLAAFANAGAPVDETDTWFR